MAFPEALFARTLKLRRRRAADLPLRLEIACRFSAGLDADVPASMQVQEKHEMRYTGREKKHFCCGRNEHIPARRMVAGL